MDAASHRLLRNGERCSFFLQPDNGITLVTGADEIAVIDLLLLQEFDSGQRLGADEQEDCAARHFVICFGQRVRIVWWSIRRASPYDPMNVDISQTGETESDNIAHLFSIPARCRILRGSMVV